jgi:hypothetical protein
MAQRGPVPELLVCEKTQDYWDRCRNVQSLDRLMSVQKWYVTELLPLEMTWVRPSSPVPANPCRTLALLVGYSLEPLLQAICFYQPQRVVLALNENYGLDTGRVMGTHIEQLVTQLTVQPGPDGEPLLHQMPQLGPRDEGGHFTEVEAGPAQVFQFLLRNLRNESPENTVVDITGAKKSMVAGAFLYAAVADVPISYVEFDDSSYNLTLNKPEGYRSVIRQLVNPYAVFALREWARVRTLYERYQFQEARDLLVGDDRAGRATIREIARIYQPQAEQAITKLADVLRCYMHWNAGGLAAAQEEGQRLPDFPLPTAVSRLGGDWFRFDGIRFSHKPARFFAAKDQLRIYACDELARIGRLVTKNRDYRSAFLRAAGLSEILMVVRLVRAQTDATERARLFTALDELPTPGIHSIFKKILSPDDQGPIRLTLRSRERTEHFSIPRFSMRKWWLGTPYGTEDGWQEFLDVRNTLAHTFASVPEQVAWAGFEFTRANLEDFLSGDGLSISSLQVDAQAMEWCRLCEFCGLDSALPPSLLKCEGGQNDSLPVGSGGRSDSGFHLPSCTLARGSGR